MNGDLNQISIDNTLFQDTKNSDNSEKKQIIEAVLFAAGHSVKFDKLSEILGLPPAHTKKLIREFADEYNNQPNRGIIMLVFDDSCQLCTKEKFAPYIKQALGIKKGGNLSASSIEVLAIIAYNEPVTRSFIDTVRGVDSAYVVSSLVQRGLIETCGRLDVPGRPRLFRTTPDFLRCFGINSLSELPEVDIPRADVDTQILISENDSDSD